MRFAEGCKHLYTPRGCHRGDLAHQAALADTRRAHHRDHRALPVDGTLQQGFNDGHFPTPTDQIRLSTPTPDVLLCHTQQSTGGYWRVSTLDLNQLRLA